MYAASSVEYFSFPSHHYCMLNMETVNLNALATARL